VHKISWNLDTWFSRYASEQTHAHTDRQTHRQTDRQTCWLQYFAHLPGGSNKSVQWHYHKFKKNCVNAWRRYFVCSSPISYVSLAYDELCQIMHIVLGCIINSKCFQPGCSCNMDCLLPFAFSLMLMCRITNILPSKAEARIRWSEVPNNI